MSRQSSRGKVITYNYDPSESQQRPTQQKPQQILKPIENSSNLEVSRQLKIRQNYSNIFNLPEEQLPSYNCDYQKKEQLMPYDIQWWNSQLIKENKSQHPVIQQQQIAQSNIVQNIPQQPVSQYQYNHQNQNKQITNPMQLIQQHNNQIEQQLQKQLTPQKLEQAGIPQKESPPKVQFVDLKKELLKQNNPNADIKSKNRQFSDVLGGGLEVYYRDHKKSNNQDQKNEKILIEESNVYGPQYHQRQMLKGMSSIFDTHNYYQVALEQQQKAVNEARQPKSASRSTNNSPGKALQEDDQLFPKPQYRQFLIRGLKENTDFEKLKKTLTLNTQLVNHKIIIKYFQPNYEIVNKWVIGQGGSVINEEDILDTEEFLKVINLKNIQKPLPITVEKEILRKKREQKLQKQQMIKPRPKSAKTQPKQKNTQK
ncbi:hypothetical protein pb186bvf_004147 [Paramecium bursaria]